MLMLIRANKDIWTDWQSCITMGPFSSSDKGLKPRNLRIVVGHPLQSFVLEQVQVLLGSGIQPEVIELLYERGLIDWQQGEQTCGYSTGTVCPPPPLASPVYSAFMFA